MSQKTDGDLGIAIRVVASTCSRLVEDKIDPLMVMSALATQLDHLLGHIEDPVSRTKYRELFSSHILTGQGS